MSTIYPNGIDSSASLPDVVNLVSSVDAALVNVLRDAIVAVEAELGVKPSSVYSTVRNRLDHIEQFITIATGGTGSFFTPGTDLNGNTINQIVVGLQGRPVLDTLPIIGQSLSWDGSAWGPQDNYTAVKNIARLASTTNLSLSGLVTVDSVTTVTGDRVVAMNQTLPAENGIWIASSGAWTRTPDLSIPADFTPGFFVSVSEGTINAGALLNYTSIGTVVVGVTAISIEIMVPGRAAIAGAVIVEDPASNRRSRRLRQADIDPDFAITSWGKSSPDGGTLLYRRGDTVTGITATAAYVSGPPTTASAANTYGGSTDPGDIGPGSWSVTPSAYTAATLAGSIKRNGTQYPSAEGSDPTVTATLSAFSTPFTRNASWTIQWTSDVYYGVKSTSIVSGTDVFNVTLQSGFSDSLQTGRGQTRTFSPATQYVNFLWPSHSQYNSGTVLIKDAITGFVIPFTLTTTVQITRNGVTRSYDVWRSDNLLTSTFTITVS